MMKKLIFCVSLFLTLLSSESSGDLGDYNIYFINGMNVSPSEAPILRQKLHDLVLPDVPNGNVGNLYQNNDAALSEMLAAVRQQASADNQREIYKRFWKCINNPSPETCDPANPPTVSLRQIVSQTLAKYDQAAYVQNPYLQAMVSVLKENYLNKNKKALLVAHSQGNLYANQVINYLQSFYPAVAACVDVVGIASPATYVAKSGLYETRSDDVVINLARADYPWGGSILPPTWTPASSTVTSDPSHHTFVASYLVPDALRKRIRDDIAASTASTVNGPCTLCTPFSQTVLGPALAYPQVFRRYIGPGRRTVSVRVDVNTPNNGYQYDQNEIFITPAFSQTILAHGQGLTAGTYRYSFVFDASQQGTNELQVIVYTQYDCSVKVCIDCGDSAATSPSACP